MVVEQTPLVLVGGGEELGGGGHHGDGGGHHGYGDEHHGDGGGEDGDEGFPPGDEAYWRAWLEANEGEEEGESEEDELKYKNISQMEERERGVIVSKPRERKHTEYKVKPRAEDVVNEETAKQKEVEAKIKKQLVLQGSGVTQVVSCKTCKKRTFTRGSKKLLDAFKEHVEGHLNIQHPCPYCTAYFMISEELQSHKKNAHINEYTSEIVINGEEKQRRRWKFKVRPVEEIVAEALLRKKQLNEKVTENTVKSGNIVSCRLCTKQFKPEPSRNVMQIFKLHVEGHLKIRSDCPYCPSTFSKSNSLKEHKRILHLKDYRAEKYFIKFQLKPDTDTQKPEYNKYTCPHCDKMFRAFNSLQKHTEKNHGSVELQQKPITEKQAVQLVNDEIKVIDNEYKCKKCNYTLPKSDGNSGREIKVHIEKHLNIKLFCQICNIVVRSLRLLKEHKKRDHEDERVLEKQLSTVLKKVDRMEINKNLTEKMIQKKGKQIDEGKEPHKVKETDDIVKQIEEKMIVDKNESGKRRYRCGECFEFGYQRTPMVLHVELHLNIQHTCTDCGAVEFTRSAFKLHMFNAHKK